MRAQSLATSKARTSSHPRTPTIYISEEQQPEPYFSTPEHPNLLNHRAGILSDFRVRDPETVRNIAIRLESILCTGDTSGSTTLISMNSEANAASVGFDLFRTPVHLETVPIPTLPEEQTRQTFSVFPSNYWQLNPNSTLSSFLDVITTEMYNVSYMDVSTTECGRTCVSQVIF